MKSRILLIPVLCIVIPMTNGGSHPGTFFWKPRLGLDLQIPTTELKKSARINMPNIQNVREGLVVLIESYQAGMTVISLAAGISSGFGTDPHLNPVSAYYYTNVFRWAMRFFTLVPVWLGGNGGNFCEITKVWRRRFYYMDQFVPKWLRYLVPFVKKEEWKKEEAEFKRFKKYSESAFGRHFRFPSKIFNDYKSEETKESVEEVSSSSEQKTRRKHG